MAYSVDAVVSSGYRVRICLVHNIQPLETCTKPITPIWLGDQASSIDYCLVQLCYSPTCTSPHHESPSTSQGSPYRDIVFLGKLGEVLNQCYE